MKEDLINRGIAIVCYMLIFAFLGSFVKVAEYSIDTMLPTSHWFLYESVEPSKDVFAIGESVSFISTSEKYRTTNLVWEDILYCKYDGEDNEKYFSFYESSKHGVEKSKMSTGEWLYNGLIPVKPSTCYLRSYIRHKDRSGAIKSQEVVGSDFRIE